MWMTRKFSSLASLAILLAMVSLTTRPAHAADRSQLSRWLSETALADLKTLAAGHPRVARRTLFVATHSDSGLAEAIAITLNKSLGRVEELQLRLPTSALVPPPEPAASVDELVCETGPAWDNEIRVAVRELDRGEVEVQLDLVDMADAETAFRRWRWQGRLSAAEREYHARPARRRPNDGSMHAPWSEDELERAAVQLSEQLACSLRPDIARSVTLQWPQRQTVPAPLAVSVNEARRRLGYYREISEAHRAADYRVRVAWRAVSDGLWQLSLATAAESEGLASVQVATYIEARLPVHPTSASRAPSRPAAIDLVEPAPGQPASEYLQVEVLEVSQSDRGLASAELRVRLRLANRARRPLEYALSLSGGHYLQCIPEPRYYRHERYGYAEGRLDPGQSTVRVMAIEGASHKPNPLFGTPRCAGFMGLEGLEDFDNEGHKVTQFIRWSL